VSFLEGKCRTEVAGIRPGKKLHEIMKPAELNALLGREQIEL